jgi:hypothetical protein
VNGDEETLIFPVAGGVGRGASTQWRSDLMAWNPSKKAVVIDVRYAAGGAVSRKATLPPLRSTVIEDVAGAFLQRPDTWGLLYVRVPVDEKPALTVVTRDAGRPGVESSDRPLSSGDAATAGSSRPALLITGVSAAPTRRVTMGIVNVASRPASVVITCSQRDGKAVGVPVRRRLDEGAAIEIDVGLDIGVDPVRSDMLLRIAVTEGSVVGWAMVYDTTTGTHVIVPGVPVAGLP